MLKKIAIFLFGLSILVVMQVSFGAKSVGTVIMAKGEVGVIDGKDQFKRMLNRKSEFFLNDIIATKVGSFAQLKLADDTLISLQPNTKYLVKEFNLDSKNPKNNRYVGRLVEGALSCLSGQGKNSTHDNHILETPLISMAIRGTFYESVFNFIRIKKSNSDVAVKTKSGSTERPDTSGSQLPEEIRKAHEYIDEMRKGGKRSPISLGSTEKPDTSGSQLPEAIRKAQEGAAEMRKGGKHSGLMTSSSQTASTNQVNDANEAIALGWVNAMDGSLQIMSKGKDSKTVDAKDPNGSACFYMISINLAGKADEILKFVSPMQINILSNAQLQKVIIQLKDAGLILDNGTIAGTIYGDSGTMKLMANIFVQLENMGMISADISLSSLIDEQIKDIINNFPGKFW